MHDTADLRSSARERACEPLDAGLARPIDPRVMSLAQPDESMRPAQSRLGGGDVLAADAERRGVAT